MSGNAMLWRIVVWVAIVEVLLCVVRVELAATYTVIAPLALVGILVRYALVHIQAVSSKAAGQCVVCKWDGRYGR
jgi:hypothetical protein